MPEFITAKADKQADADGEMLRLVTEVQTLIRGASPVTLKKLGTSRLNDLRSFLVAENDALTRAATEVKALNASCLSIDALKGLGMDRLRELGAKGAPAREFAGYSINALIDGCDRRGA